MKDVFTLYELNEMAHYAIKKMLPDYYWVKAEINEFRVGSGGHCYIEFVENSELRNVPVAKARGVIWANVYKTISKKFESEANTSMSVGLKVLVKVSVEFHEIYGYSLNVADIDPAYTLGELYLKRQEIIRRLEKDGVIDMNKDVEFPIVPQRIAVVSSPNAAGWGDFKKHLENNPYGIRFDLTLFPTVMQGEKVESSVISSLDSIFDRIDDFDVVVIIRGGGATSDLTGFDTYDLASHCAQFPLPIISGIGHERDKTVLDYVAHVSVKTPTAAAQYLITQSLIFVDFIKNCAANIERNISSLVSEEKIWNSQVVTALGNLTSKYIINKKNEMDNLNNKLTLEIRNLLSVESNKISLVYEKLLSSITNKIVSEKHQLFTDKITFGYRLKELVKQEQHNLEIFEQIIRNNNPKRVMEKGYVIVRNNGKAIFHTGSFVMGEKYNLETVDGSLDIIINKG